MVELLLLIFSWGLFVTGAATIFSIRKATSHALKQIQTSKQEDFDTYWAAKNSRRKWDKYAWRGFQISIVLSVGLLAVMIMGIFS